MEQSQFIIPDLQNYRSAKEFFIAFFELNKTKNRRFSYRLFSFYIKWPPSYFSDLVNGRKGLSFQRAIQFASFFKLKDRDAARLIWFTLLESPHAIVKQFANEQLTSSDSQPRLSAKAS